MDEWDLNPCSSKRRFLARIALNHSAIRLIYPDRFEPITLHSQYNILPIKLQEITKVAGLNRQF